MSKITVIIPAYNEEQTIETCLESLTRQTHLDFEVFVVDDQSLDKTRELIQKFVDAHPNRFRLFEFGKVGPARARNLCASKAGGEILAFMDSDCIATPQWLSQLEGSFAEHAEVASVGGPHLLRPQATQFEATVEQYLRQVSRFIDFYKDEAQPAGYTNHNPLCNVAYRKNIFLELGGFREDLFPGEDIEFDLRLRADGHKIFYNPHAKVFHRRPLSEEEFKHMMFKYGRAQGQMLRARGAERLSQRVALVLILCLAFFLGGAIAGSTVSLFVVLTLAAALVVPTPRTRGVLSLHGHSRRWFWGFVLGLFLRHHPAKHHKTM